VLPEAPVQDQTVHATAPLSRLAGLIVATALALGFAVTLAATTVAYTPSDGLRSVLAAAREANQGVPGGAGGGRKVSRGYDISYPQCGGPYPSNPLFAIVGVNGGLVFKANPCLADQLRWGGDAAAEAYINTGNPGPALSSHWPNGQTSPRLCDAGDPDTADCAYDYGWNAAEHSYQTLVSAYAVRGITANPNATAWWLDVETSNSWRDVTALNVAALQGEADYLSSRGVTRLGFYSTTYQWGVITGGTTTFAASPSWGAGASSERAARNLCATTTTSFTGGRLAMTQYIYQGFDANVRC
jgi:hypothetical protein